MDKIMNDCEHYFHPWVQDSHETARACMKCGMIEEKPAVQKVVEITSYKTVMVPVPVVRKFLMTKLGEVLVK